MSEVNKLSEKKHKYTIWQQGIGTVTGSKCIYNEDRTDYYEIPCEIDVTTTDPIETNIVFYTEAEAKEFCRKNSSEYYDYYYQKEIDY